MYVRLATTGPDYAKCKRALDLEKPYEYPTIMVEREDHGKLIGFLTTSTESGFIVAGPIWASPELPGPAKVRVFLRIFDAYGLVLGKNGVDRYLFWIPQEDEHFIDHMRRALDIDPYEIDDQGRIWFKVQLKEQEDGRQQYNGTGASN